MGISYNYTQSQDGYSSASAACRSNDSKLILKFTLKLDFIGDKRLASVALYFTCAFVF